MNTSVKRSSQVLLLSLSLLAAGHAHAASRDVLWNRLSQKCVPDYLAADTYQPCALVNLDDRYVIYKVDNDPYQYLLLPTDRITGIEDARLLNDDTPNYFYLAWLSRTFLTEKLDRKLKEKDISLTVNAANTRTQDQLHIHISCLSKEARAVLDRVDIRDLGTQWTPLPEQIRKHTYYAKKLSLSELKTDNVFRMVKEKVASDSGNMKYTGVALVNVDKATFLVLEASGTLEKGVSAEEIQEHGCALAH